MKVATWRGGTTFTLDRVPSPHPGPGDVVVRVDTVGICGTDVHITQGLFPASPPAVLGHEFSGVVVAVGPGVSPDRIGEAVACDLSTHCLDCVECRAGRWNRCVHARKTGGAFAEQVLVPADSALRVPAGLDLAVASLAEPASCCLVGVEMVPLPPEAVVLVIGGGIMGLLTLAFAKARGARTGILSDPLPARREAARRLGADLVHDPTREDLRAVVGRATDGVGVHLACEAVGKPELVGLAVEVTRPRGTVLMIGVNPVGSRLPADLYDLHYREIVVRGAFGRGDGFARALALLPTLRLDHVITAQYPLDRIGEAVAAATAGEGVKTVIVPGRPR